MRLRRLGVAAGTVLAVVAVVSPARAYEAADQQRLLAAMLTATEAAAITGIPGALAPAPWPSQCDSDASGKRLGCQWGYYPTAAGQVIAGHYYLQLAADEKDARQLFGATADRDREIAGAMPLAVSSPDRSLTFIDAPNFRRVEGLRQLGRLVVRARCSGDVGTSIEAMASCANAALDAQMAKLASAFPAVLPPTASASVGAQTFRNTATVSWSPAVSSGFAENVDYVVTSDPPGVGCRTSELTCTIRDLTPGTSYRFTVVAVNSAGSSAGVTSSRAVRASVPSGPVRNASAARRGSVVRVTWKVPAVTGGVPVLRYEVRSTPAGGTCETRSTSCDITGLTPGREYRFTVVARNAAGVSRKVATQAVRIPVPPPAPTPVPLPAPEPDKPTATFS